MYVKNGSYHPNIKFAYEKEVKDTLHFLDVLFIRNLDHIHTTVFRKEPKNDLYLYWHAIAPISWKRGTLRTLDNRASIICSGSNDLQKELQYLERIFYTQNGYTLWIII